MFDFLKTGGLLGMGLITICALIVVVLSIFVIHGIFVKKDYSGKGLTGILFFGSLAPLIGIIWQMTGMMMAFDAIREAGDISISLVVEGLKVSMYAPLYGLIVLFAAALFWYILREELKNKRIRN